MKNIHVLPTDKPSVLYKRNDLKTYHLGDFNICNPDDKLRTNQNIYIISDEEIRKGDWCYHPLLKGGCIIQSKFDNPNSTMKKIILTTDQDLIKDGVQAIDDEFLEWFSKNLSCESVEVENERIVIDDINYNFDVVDYKYKIIIPKKETEQKLYTEKEVIKLLESIEKEINIRKKNILKNSKKMPQHLLEGGLMAFESSVDAIKEKFAENKK